MGNRKLQIQGSNHTLSLNDGQQKIQSNSCDDLISETEVSVLSQQNLPNPPSVPVTWKVNSVISKNKAKWKILKTTKRLEKKEETNKLFLLVSYIYTVSIEPTTAHSLLLQSEDVSFELEPIGTKK